MIAATARDQRAFSASALFSKRLRGARSVQTDIIASLNVHANIEEITALELSCLILCLTTERLNLYSANDFVLARCGFVRFIALSFDVLSQPKKSPSSNPDYKDTL